MTTTQAPRQQSTGRARRLPLPVTEPPFDDELGIVPGAWRPLVPAGQAMLPFGPDGGPDAGFGAAPVPVVLGDEVVADSLWLRHTDQRAATPAVTLAAGPAVPEPRRGEDGLPDPRRWIARLALSALECLHGRRSLQQLVRWTDEPVYRALARRAADQEGTPAERPRIRALRVCRLTDTVAEASVVVQVGRATRAVAVRLRADDGRWLCTAFDIVDPGPPPRRGRRQRAAQASSNATA
ncbi:Rv3235 family protein [Jiangella mangrovi]|uniref:Uncharacterized protein n=1 Tax=Jiangella mangrovi TaxID=1524084 RepID=A0A7W9GR54_9ACTN|nr:Rv3235 family protein [Jiangella mangrovi]MBB5788495.1 hypothetical protein [Jiangella mangrovi]